ncbi:HD-GYP domain-containing protein [Piscinibacterium candidicorallinum]|uniref:HD-GYP domain-containing protein n=1 Tax=Piscinibacterium candidicorallinum TaxID=1793872 RepID=A0ABV7H9P6_9BURK
MSRPAHWIEVPVEQAREGLFVAELDRPWDETPFMLQGFLLDADALSVLQQHCRMVVVDPSRSDDAALRALPAPLVSAWFAEPVKRVKSANTVAPDPVQPGWAASLAALIGGLFGAASGPSLERPRRLAPGEELDAPHRSRPPGFGLLMTLLGLFERRTTEIKPRAAAERLAQIPADQPLLVYPTAQPISAAALKDATAGIARVGAVAERLFAEDGGAAELEVSELRAAIDELSDVVVRSPDAAMWMARMRDYDSVAYARSLKTSVILMTLARHIGFPKHELQQLGMVGMLLDVGKLALPRELLDTPGPLDEAALAIARTHVTESVKMLESDPEVAPAVLRAVGEHHERLNGSGYPGGLKDRGISIFGQLAGLVDVMVALTSPRPYAKTFSTYEAMMHLFDAADEGQFHGPLVEQLVQSVGLFPVGSLVELSNGEVAAVSGHNPIRRLEPKVLVLTNTSQQPLPSPFERDLLYRPVDAGGRPIHIVRALPVGAYGVDPRQFYLG